MKLRACFCRQVLIRAAFTVVFAGLMARGVRAADEAQEVLPVQVFKNLQAGKKQSVVVYGTSLSAIAAWPNAVKEYFDKQYPGLVTFANAAQSGQNSNWGVTQLQGRVLSRKPDLVFLEFSINDSVTRVNMSTEKSADNLTQMVKALRDQNPQVEIILQTMSPVWNTPANPGRTAESDRPRYVEYYDVYRKYAQEHKMPLVDQFPNWVKLQKEDEAKFKKWLPDGTHPIAEGSLAVTWAGVQGMLEKSRVAAGGTPTSAPSAPAASAPAAAR